MASKQFGAQWTVKLLHGSELRFDSRALEHFCNTTDRLRLEGPDVHAVFRRFLSIFLLYAVESNLLATCLLLNGFKPKDNEKDIMVYGRSAPLIHRHKERKY